MRKKLRVVRTRRLRVVRMSRLRVSSRRRIKVDWTRRLRVLMTRRLRVVRIFDATWTYMLTCGLGLAREEREIICIIMV